MNITLLAINATYSHSNIAIRYLAQALECQGLCPDLLEFSLKDKHAVILDALVNSPSEIIAFSVYIWNIEIMLKLAEKLKMLRPSIHIIFGGPEVSFETADFFLNHPYVDTIIAGEGEEIISEVCNNCSRYIHKIIHGMPYSSFSDSGILYDKYPAKGKILYYESSRGCPHRCSYCLSSISSKLVAKSVKKTMSDLKNFEELENKPQIIKFIDRTFNYDMHRAKAIWSELLKEEYSLKYHFEICADKLDEESLEILSRFPKGKIQFEAGIQSTNPATLKSINRSTDSCKAISNLVRLKKIGNIHIHADLIAGLPYEGINEFKKSFDDTIKCCDKLQLGFLKLLKGSHIRNQADEHKYIFDPKPPYTVLKNKYLGYDELYKLTKLADVIDRLYSSNRFKHTVDYIVSNVESPFDFFYSFSDSLPCNIDKMSQHQCRISLAEYLSENKFNKTAFEYLALDTLIHENKRPPEILSGYYKPIDNTNIINIPAEYFNTLRKNNFEVFEFNFDKDCYYMINRTEHTLIKIRKLS